MASDLLNCLEMINPLMPNERLIVGGQPSIADLELLKAQGVTTVINLRPESEPNDFSESQIVNQLGMEYCHIPLSTIESFTEEACHCLRQTLASSKSCLIHCATGNRAGALIALKSHWLDNLPAEQAIEYGKQAGLTMLEPQIRNLLGLTR